MHTPNILSMEYFDNAERIADLLNGFYFHGQQFVHPANILEKSESISRSDNNNNKKISQILIHDSVHQITINMNVFLLAFENQDKIHYAMPIRAINGDACEYWRQWKKLKAKHYKNHDLKTGAEYLSGLSSSDVLTAITTLVIYWGKEPWNAPKTLKEMLNIRNAPPEIQNLFFDYAYHLLDVRRFPHIEYFHTDLQWVFGFLQNSEDKEKLNYYINSHISEFENLADDAYDLICEIADARLLKKFKKRYQNNEGGVDMCKALQDMIDESKRLGRLEGHSNGREEGFQAGKKQGLQEGMKQGLQEGKKQGLQEGKKQGLQEGKKQGLQEGKKQGLQEGKKQGLQEGKKQGLQEGKKQGEKRGIRQGKKQGLQQGIELSQKVFHLYQKRCSYEYIARECNISINKVKYILGHTAS